MRELLLERYDHGVGTAIANALGLPREAIYRFKNGLTPFPDQRLEELRSFLERLPADPQFELRDRLRRGVECGALRVSDVARVVGVSKSSISRFKDGHSDLTEAPLTALRTYLEGLQGDAGAQPEPTPRRSTSNAARSLTEEEATTSTEPEEPAQAPLPAADEARESASAYVASEDDLTASFVTDPESLLAACEQWLSDEAAMTGDSKTRSSRSRRA